MHAISCCSDRSDTGFASAARSTPGQSRVLRSGARRHLHVSANTGDGYTPAPTAIIIINCNNSKLTYRQEIALPQPFSLPASRRNSYGFLTSCWNSYGTPLSTEAREGIWLRSMARCVPIPAPAGRAAARAPPPLLTALGPLPRNNARTLRPRAHLRGAARGSTARGRAGPLPPAGRGTARAAGVGVVHVAEPVCGPVRTGRQARGGRGSARGRVSPRGAVPPHGPGRRASPRVSPHGSEGARAALARPLAQRKGGKRGASGPARAPRGAARARGGGGAAARDGVRGAAPRFLGAHRGSDARGKTARALGPPPGRPRGGRQHARTDGRHGSAAGRPRRATKRRRGFHGTPFRLATRRRSSRPRAQRSLPAPGGPGGRSRGRRSAAQRRERFARFILLVIHRRYKRAKTETFLNGAGTGIKYSVPRT